MSRTDHLFMPLDHMEGLYNSKNPLVRFVHRQRLAAIASAVPRTAGLKILDGGCGEGHCLQKLHELNAADDYYGVDVTRVALAAAEQRCPFAKFTEADIAKMDFPDGYFDVVIVTECLEHVIEYNEAVTELKRVLKKGGLLIVTFPNEFLWTVSRFFLGRRPVKVPDHVNSFTPGRMADIVGLPIVRRRNLPFNLPFWLSLGCLIEFKK